MDKGTVQQLDGMFDRPDLKPRSLAIVIDLSISVGLVFTGLFTGFLYGGTKAISGFGSIGSISAGLFFLLRDGVHKSASPGKRFAGLKVVGEKGNFINLFESASRNFALSLPFFTLAFHQFSALLIPFLGKQITVIGPIAILLGIIIAVADGLTLLLDRPPAGAAVYHSTRFSERSCGTRVVEVDV